MPPTSAPAPALADDAIAALPVDRPLLALFDIDGTLAPIVARPEDAAVPPATREALAALIALPQVHVGLVTGRSAADGARLVGLPGVWVIGNHGIETVPPHGAPRIAPDAEPFADRLARAAAALAGVVGEHPGAELEHKGWSLTLHYRRAAPQSVPALRAAAEQAALREGLRLAEGKAVFELKLPIAVDKGTTTVTLAREVLGAAGGSVLFAGDDVTDEDAFRDLGDAFPDAVTIRVGAPEMPTSARWSVSGPDAIRDVIERLVGARRHPAA